MQFVPYPGEASPAYVARLLNVPVRTARYWRQQRRMPAAFGRLWDISQDPDLGVINEQWRGFRLRDGHIETPEGRTVTAGDIASIPYIKDLLNYYRQREGRPAQYLMEF